MISWMQKEHTFFTDFYLHFSLFYFDSFAEEFSVVYSSITCEKIRWFLIILLSLSYSHSSIFKFLSCSSVNGTISQLSGLYPTYYLMFSLCDTTAIVRYFFNFSYKISFCFFRLGSTFLISNVLVGSAYRSLKYSFRN